MRRFDITTSVTEYTSDAELPESDRTLLSEARKATFKAYAPYSRFNVGAALLLDNGTVVTGNNQENVAYPSGLCAERVAIYSAGALYPDVAVKAIAVSCRSEQFHIGQPLSPCGACRQAIAEYENRSGQPIRIILGGTEGPVYVLDSIASLLPLMFKAEELKR